MPEMMEASMIIGGPALDGAARGAASTGSARGCRSKGRHRAPAYTDEAGAAVIVGLGVAFALPIRDGLSQ
jgi:hypothetical protein